MTRLDNARKITAPRGTTLNAKSWMTEAPLRMLMNNLDAEVAERPEELVVYGGIGRAARDWESFDRIVSDVEAGSRRIETLLVQSGKPVGVFTNPRGMRPRVLIANSNLVPHWANWDAFQRARSQRPDDVRPDDGRKLDLYRHAGHRAGHLRDLRRNGSPALQQ